MKHDAEPWTVQKLLEWTRPFFERKGVTPARLNAERLLAHVLDVPRLKLYTDFERPLELRELDRFRDLVKRAADEEPVAYLTGSAPFFNLEFTVDRRVLIPRPDTETLVEQILQRARRDPAMGTAPRVLDLCTGSGCIAAAVAHHLPGAQVVATDTSTDALDVARDNVERLGLADRVRLLQGDLYAALATLPDREPFDVIVSNPPYIPSSAVAALDRSVREYEPHVALDGGGDGLDLHRRIIGGASEWSHDTTRLFLEIQFDQADRVVELIRRSDAFDDVTVSRDLGGNDRVVSARAVQATTTDAR